MWFRLTDGSESNKLGRIKTETRDGEFRQGTPRRETEAFKKRKNRKVEHQPIPYAFLFSESGSGTSRNQANGSHSREGK